MPDETSRIITSDEHVKKTALQRAFGWVHHHWKISAGIGLAVAVILAVQLAYPGDRALPFTRLDDRKVGSLHKQDISQLLISDYSRIPLRLEIKGGAKTTTQKSTILEAGLKPDTQKVLENTYRYTWWQRLIPGSLLVLGATRNQAVTAKLDGAQFDQYAAAQLKICAVAPKNASVTVKDGAVVLDSAKNGQSCDKKALERAITKVPLKKTGATATLKARVDKPKRTDQDVKGLLSEAEKLSKRKISLELAGQTYPVDQATLASWLVFSEDPKDPKKVKVDVDTAPIRDYLGKMQAKIYIAPTVTVIRTTDSVETSRTEGTAGRGINHSTTADALKTQVLKGDGTVTGELIPIPSRVTYERSYTATKAGLQALVNDLSADNGGFAISARLADGTLVSAKGTARIHPASTYKLYVAYSVLLRIDRGQMKWEDAAFGGNNVSQCFDLMIVNSDNDCAEWFGDKIGWSSINGEVSALGLSDTNTIRGKMYTSTNDLTLFVRKLHTESIMSTASRDRLLDTMRRQVYRAGIPAGVGVTVADKVGFLNGALNDAAIVYAPKGTYELAIMTTGSTWGTIANVSRQIHQQIQRL